MEEMDTFLDDWHHPVSVDTINAMVNIWLSSLTTMAISMMILGMKILMRVGV